MTICKYEPRIQIGFGRTITSEVHNEEFQAIEEAFSCICDEVDRINECDAQVYDHGTVSGTYYIDPGLGLVHKMLCEGDVELIIETPDGVDPGLISLMIGDGGDGRFNFPVGASWSSDAQGVNMDGKPWDPEGTAGDYGAIVQCIYDDLGWVHVVFARHDLDQFGPAEVEDIYNWR